MFEAMNTSHPPVILSTEGFTLRSDLVAHAEEKAGKLQRHLHPHVECVRLHVKRHTPHTDAPLFAVCATAEESAGPDFVVHAASPEPVTAINAAFDKLERAVAAAARARKHWQRHDCPVEVGGSGE